MRMSFSRFAAIGASLVAGVTLASCASSSAPIPGTGLNGQVVSFQGAILFFLQGSPQLNLGISTVDLYIDGKFSGTYPYGCSGPPVCFGDEPLSVPPLLFNLPAGPHDFKLTQVGTLNPVFLEKVLTLKAGTKYALVAAGDAGNSNTRFDLFVVPHYNTTTANASVTVFNASSRAGTVDVDSFCDPDGPALICNPDYEFASDVSVDSSQVAAEGLPGPGIPLIPAPTYCISAYPPGTTTPLLAGWPTQTSDESLDINCEGAIKNGQNVNFFIIDFGQAPVPAPPPNSIIIGVPDQNG